MPLILGQEYSSQKKCFLKKSEVNLEYGPAQSIFLYFHSFLCKIKVDILFIMKSRWKARTWLLCIVVTNYLFCKTLWEYTLVILLVLPSSAPFPTKLWWALVLIPPAGRVPRLSVNKQETRACVWGGSGNYFWKMFDQNSRNFRQF